MDLHKKVSTGLGMAIILIFAITCAVFSFKVYEYQVAQWESENQSYVFQANPVKKPMPADNAQLANPASVYCTEHGGKLEIRTGKDGGQAGFCIFKDGKECEEWSYMRGECPAKEIPVEETWKTYRNDEYGFEVQFPGDYTVEQNGTAVDYLVKGISDKSASELKVSVWKNFDANYGGPGAMHYRIAHDNWRYFIDNSAKIESGDCNDEEKTHSSVLGSPDVCKIIKRNGYLAVETDEKGYVHDLTFYGKDMTVSFNLGKSTERIVLDKMITTFKFTK